MDYPFTENVITLSHDSLDLKPCCVLDSRSLVSRNVAIWSATVFSRTLDSIGTMVISQWPLTPSVSKDLKDGIIMPREVTSGLVC